jgi:hypothetical protein
MIARTKIKLVRPVHDELVLGVSSSELQMVKKEIPGLMANVAKVDVPLVAEPQVGNSLESNVGIKYLKESYWYYTFEPVGIVSTVLLATSILHAQHTPSGQTLAKAVG